MSGSIPIALAIFVAISMVARNLWPIFFDCTLLEMLRERRGKILLVKSNRRGHWRDALLKLSISHWLSIGVAVVLLIVIGARLLQNAGAALANSALESQIASLKDENNRLRQQFVALQRTLEEKEQVIVGFLGGETWQILSELLDELGLEIQDVDPKTYSQLRFEKRIRADQESIYLYSRSSEPQSIVYLEGRIDADDECWSANDSRDQMLRRIQQMVDETLTNVAADAHRGDWSLILKRKMTISRQTTADSVSLAINQLSMADRVTRNESRSLCQGSR